VMVIQTGILVRMAFLQLMNTSLKFLKSKVTKLLQLINRNQVPCLSVISNQYRTVAKTDTTTVKIAYLYCV
jgi:hypothetical protein